MDSILEQYAEKTLLNRKNGVAYGEISGFMTTITENYGCKEIYISLYMPDDETSRFIKRQLEDPKTVRKFRIVHSEVTENFVSVQILDNSDDMKYFNDFRMWFFPVLNESCALGTNFCPICKKYLSRDDKVYKLMNRKACAFHRDCAEKVVSVINVQNERYEKEKGNYIKGFLGAVLGVIPGAILWAAFYAAGWYASLAGFLIGFLAFKGYKLFGGKTKRTAIGIVAISVVMAISFAEIYGCCMKISLISGQALLFPPRIQFFCDMEHIKGFLIDTLSGLVFAVLGAYRLMVGDFRKAAERKIKIVDI